MNWDFSQVGFLYGIALVLAVSKAFTVLIWRTLPKPRPPLRQEVMEAWRRRKLRKKIEKEAPHEPQDPHLDPQPESQHQR
jgi:hypothetical protein